MCKFITLFLEYPRAYLRVGGGGNRMDVEKNLGGKGLKGGALGVPQALGPEGWSREGQPGLPVSHSGSVRGQSRHRGYPSLDPLGPPLSSPAVALSCF